MDANRPPELRLQIPLGRLVSACDALPGVYHIQDASGALVPVMVMRKRSLRNVLASRRFGAAVVALGALAIAASGLYAWTRLHSLPSRLPPVVALPIAQPNAQPSDPVRIVDAPYSAGASQAAGDAPLPLAPAQGQMPVATAPAAPAAPAVPEVIAMVPAPAAPAAAPPAPAPVPVLPAPATGVRLAPAQAEPLPAHAPPARTVPTKPHVAPAAKVAPAPVPLPAAAPKAAMAAAPQPAAATTPAAARDEPFVYNEVSQPSRAPQPAAAPAPVPKIAGEATPVKPGVDTRIRLVAIKDAQTALLHLPGNPLPVPVKPGTKLPNGLTLTGADPAKGTVRFDNGTTLSLE